MRKTKARPSSQLEEAQAVYDSIPESNKAAKLVAEGLVNMERWRNVDAMNCFKKALDMLT